MRQIKETQSPQSKQRDTLLDVATAEFAENGYEVTSIQRIASAAGISKAKVFYYFGGKEDLFFQVLDRTMAPIIEPLEAAPTVKSAEEFWASLEAGIDHASAFGRNDPHAAALLRDLFRRGDETQALARLTDRVRAAISNWLRDGRAVGAVRTDLSVPILSEAMVGALVQIDRWLAEHMMDGKLPEDLLDDTSIVALARDAIKQRLPLEMEVEVSYAAGNVPRETDAYLDIDMTVSERVTMRNGRERSPEATFEREGFELFPAPVVFPEPPDDIAARATYGAVEQTLKDRLGASFARVFDHTVRHTERVPGQRPPIRIVHADYGSDAGHRRLAELLPTDDAERLANARIVVANLWQSVAGVVHSTPLGFVDIKTVKDDDFIPITVHYGNRDGEIGYYRPNSAHKWYWFPFMRPEESVLFKTYDGQPVEQHWSCPHGAFTAPSSPAEQEGRRTSIEYRILLAFEGE
ncbi:MAG: TetR/AcrR family transcriptional regulator [Pseudomonadota bacterium]